MENPERRRFAGSVSVHRSYGEGVPLLPGFIGAMACNGVFALGIELGGLTYKGDKL